MKECINSKEMKEIFSKIKDVMTKNKDFLFKLDSAIGDGDLGITMVNGFSKVEEALSSYTEDKIGKVIVKAGIVLAEASPSTVGTLIADGLIKAGMILNDKTEVSLSDLSLFFTEFVNRIIETGIAKFGEKTLVDSLYPAAESLKESALKNRNLKDSFKEAYEKAKGGFETTKDLVSKYGRAKWYGEKSNGIRDPGAAAGMLFVKAFYDYFKGR
jgi:dihydroxyacetone kinase-like protein